MRHAHNLLPRYGVVAVSLAVAVAIVVVARAERVAELFDQAQARLAAGDRQGANQSYEGIIADDGAPAHQRSIAGLILAQSLLADGRLAAAANAYGRVIQVKDAPLHHLAEARRRLSVIDRLRRGLPGEQAGNDRVQATAPRAAATFHVAPNGSDDGTGAADAPFATVERARDAIRRLKRTSGLPPGGVAVVVAGGRYPVSQTFKLTEEDSGTAATPIAYVAAEGQRPVFDGGVALSRFQPVTDEAILRRLPEAARGKVVRVGLAAHGIDKALPLTLGGFASGRGFRTHPVMELFFNGRAMSLARWPNRGTMVVKTVEGPTPQQSHGLVGCVEGVFTCDGDRLARWADERDIVLYGYWFWDWADSYERVASIDAAAGRITLAAPYHRYGYRVGQQFIAQNLLSEIDEPGEWYLDRQRGVVYLYPPSDPAGADVRLSVTAVPFVELDNVAHVGFRGLTWEYGCVDGVLIRNSRDVLLAGCTVRHIAGNGVEVYGGQRVGLLSCDVHSLGRGGVILSGGDRRTLTRGDHFVQNCHIFDLSRIDRTYTPAVLVTGVGQRVAHNLIHDVPSSALRVGGNDHLIELNELCRVVLESDDQGAVDMWGNPTFRGNVYRFNYFHHIGRWRPGSEQTQCGQAGIRLDDAISGVLIYGNVFRRSSAGRLGFGGVQIHGGKDNILDGNLFIDCASAVSFSTWGEARWRDFVAGAMASRDIDAGLYLRGYPLLGQLSDHVNLNHLWRNVTVGCGRFLHRGPGDARVEGNAELRRSDLSGVLPYLEGASDRPATLDAGITAPIPFDRIGLYTDDFRRQLPADLTRRLRHGDAPPTP